MILAFQRCLRVTAHQFPFLWASNLSFAEVLRCTTSVPVCPSVRKVLSINNVPNNFKVPKHSTVHPPTTQYLSTHPQQVANVTGFGFVSSCIRFVCDQNCDHMCVLIYTCIYIYIYGTCIHMHVTGDPNVGKCMFFRACLRKTGYCPKMGLGTT